MFAGNFGTRRCRVKQLWPLRRACLGFFVQSRPPHPSPKDTTVASSFRTSSQGNFVVKESSRPMARRLMKNE